MDPFNICSWITKHQRYAHARNLYSQPDLESIGFDRVMQSGDIIFNPGGNHSAADWNLVVSLHALTPEAQLSLYLSAWQNYPAYLPNVRPHRSSIWTRPQQNTGIEKISSLIEPNPIHLGQKQAVPGVCQQFLLSWVFPYRKSGDLGT